MPPSYEPSSVVGLSVADVLDKKVFSFQDSVAVDVRDVAAAQRWYAGKMGLDYSSTDVEQADMVLGYSAQNAYLYLVKVTGADRRDRTPGRPPIIFAGKLMVEFPSWGGVDVGSLQEASGGNHFFWLPGLAKK